MRTISYRKDPVRAVAFVLSILLLLSAIFFAAGCEPDAAREEASSVADGDGSGEGSSESSPDGDETDPPVGSPPEIFGEITEYSTYASGEFLSDRFGYSDAWFSEDPARRNDALALLSMQLSAAAVTDDEDGYGAVALRAMGFEGIGFKGFHSEDPDDCAYTYATKQLDDCTLVAIIVQTYSFDRAIKIKGWKQNFRINGESASGEHAALAVAAEKVLDGIANLGGERVKYWITGESRGGALANLIAAKLPEKLGASNRGIYAYTFEAPPTVDAALAQTESGKYAYIHNYITSDDVFTMLPMWGMVRYGVDHELKTEATELSLREELENLGSKAAGISVGSYEEQATEFVKYLEARVSVGSGTTGSRADYSLLRRDIFGETTEEPVVIEYNYQDTLVHLMESVFSGEFDGISTGSLGDLLQELKQALYLLANALGAEERGDLSGAAAYYWQAARMVRARINEGKDGVPVSLTDVDFYALLRLLAPLLVDPANKPTGDGAFMTAYILPILKRVNALPNLVYSHQFETVIARLKIRASLPVEAGDEAA